MAQPRYIIEGNEIRQENVSVERVGLVSELLPTLATYHPLEMQRLPRDVTYIKTTPDGVEQQDVRVIVTQPPQIRTIRFNESGGRENTRTSFDLAMPFFHFWFKMRGSKVRANHEDTWVWAPQRWGIMWSRAPFNGPEDTVGVSPGMPNSWGDTRVCFGANPIEANQSMGSYIDALINTYWTSEFNTDLDVILPYGGGTRSGLSAWQDESQANHDVWLTWSHIWNRERPLKELIEMADTADWVNAGPDSVAGEPIPDIPIIPTFANVNAWLNALNESDRARLIEAAVNRADG